MKKYLILFIFISSFASAQINLNNPQTIGALTRNQSTGKGLQIGTSRDTLLPKGKVILDNLRGFGMGVVGIDNNGLLSWVASGGGSTPAGQNNQIQFNASGAFGASPSLYWDSVSNQFGITAKFGSVPVILFISPAGDTTISMQPRGAIYFKNTGTSRPAMTVTQTVSQPTAVFSGGTGVGIGTVAPTQKLDVNGFINCDTALFMRHSITYQIDSSIAFLSVGNANVFDNSNIESVFSGTRIGYGTPNIGTNLFLYGVNIAGINGGQVIALGDNACNFLTGSFAVGLGAQTLDNASGSHLFASGQNAGNGLLGDNDIAIGDHSGFALQGNNNIANGKNSGSNSHGDNCVFLGAYAGQDNTESNVLIISPLDVGGIDSTTALIYGKGDVPKVRINGQLQVSTLSGNGDVLVGAHNAGDLYATGLTGNSFWNTQGNAGTDPSTNFIGTTDDSDLVFKVGNNPAGLLNISGNNTLFGHNFWSFDKTTNGNTLIGSFIGSTLTGNNNTALGYLALNLGGNSNDNVAIGKSALQNTTDGGIDNTAIGGFALTSNTTGQSNTAVGFQSLNTNDAGNSNVAIGLRSMNSNISGNQNVAVGYDALNINSTGNANIAIGYDAMYGSGTGSNNIAIGFGSLIANSTGGSNTAIGYATLNNTSGNFNIAIGNGAGKNDSINLDNRGYIASRSYNTLQKDTTYSPFYWYEGATPATTREYFNGNTTTNGTVTINGNLYMCGDTVFARVLSSCSPIDIISIDSVTINGVKIKGDGTMTPQAIQMPNGTAKYMTANQSTFMLSSTNAIPVADVTGAVQKADSNTTGNFATPAYVASHSGAGTVTTVSIVTANGFSGSVATATTTPAITISQSSIASGVTATTQSANDNSTKIATTAYVATAIANAPMLVAHADSLAQTTADANVTSYTTSAIGSYRVGGYVNITAIATNTVNFKVSFTDENSNVQTLTFFPQGLTSAALATTGAFAFPTMDIRVKSGTTITLLTTATGIGSQTYNISCSIMKLY